MEIKIIVSSIAVMLIASIIFFSGCVEEEPTTVEELTPSLTAEPTFAQNYTWYHNDEFNYKISYPENWTMVSQEVTTPDELSRTSFEEPDSTSTFSVSIASITSEVDMEEIKAQGKEVVINEMKGYQVTQAIPLAGMKITMVVFEVDDKYYAIVCTTSEELFDEYSDTFDYIINSFEITQTTTPHITPTETVTATPTAERTPRYFIVACTVSQINLETIEITYAGGPDAEMLQSLEYTISEAGYGVITGTFPGRPIVGEKYTISGDDFSRHDHVVITGTWDDGTKQVIVDTYV